MGPKSTTKINGLILIFIDFYAPMLKINLNVLRHRNIAPARTAKKIYFPSLRVLSLLFPQSCSLAMAIVLSPVYTAVTFYLLLV
jgi:hypothetical protein